jgi:hypothetical protein
MEIPDTNPIFYRGHEGFKQILRDKKINLPGRAIRVYNYGQFAGDEKLYVIGINGQLFDAQKGSKVEPSKVLSRKSAPHGWSVEGIELTLLPEEELKKVLESHNTQR